MNKYDDIEFNKIIQPILNNKEFLKTQRIAHHNTTRFDHSLRVAYYTYKVAKALRLEYRDTTEAALLHDFFIDDVKNENFVMRLRKHPSCAVNNSLKFFDLNEKQIDIIKTHMFPITFTPPKYLESWLVNLVDDVSAIYEKGYSVRTEFSAAMTFMFLLILSILKIEL